MFRIKNIVFIAVGAIVLMHTITQHEHTVTNNTLELRAHDNCGSVLEDILITFSLNHGEGHLEHFVNVYFTIPELLLSETLNVVFIEDNIIFYDPWSKNIYTYIDFPPDPLRGPPIS